MFDGYKAFKKTLLVIRELVHSISGLYHCVGTLSKVTHININMNQTSHQLSRSRIKELASLCYVRGIE